jgi:hypothetical protein
LRVSEVLNIKKKRKVLKINTWVCPPRIEGWPILGYL